MPDFVYDMDLAQLALTITILIVGSVLIGVVIIKPILRLLMGTGPDFNQNVSYVTAGFSLFYGLLLGLLTVAAYQNNERIRSGIQDEASMLGALYTSMDSYPEPLRSDVRGMMRDYALFTINADWPAHRHGRILNGGVDRVAAIRNKLGRFEPQTKGQELLHAEVLSGFQRFVEARQVRLSGTITGIPGVLWYAVLVGAAVNILLIVLLRMRTLQQFVLGSITAFFLGVILFVIIVLDRPLRGPAALQPDSFVLLWQKTMVWDEANG
ncbi:DUF4239 domain-containing protein [Tabrizicola sp. J26]|uniref:bestrophin-like domain n=1 Tax=Alitabrizicola rongguiensis TaxID=2909234 RepID=UPI001F167187|nr:DUF4239 domain-containing protein [Tabrizicola rongguiensis]MCF1709962.1 DUF4239 domain-containing protein [Tabrizicola rongguiensis]